MEECSRLLKDGVKKTNETFSMSLFWISTFYLTAMIFTAYFTLSFLLKTISGENLTGSGVAAITEFFFGTISMILTLCYINYMSDEVYGNLQGILIDR